jgi:hypothetical protein
MGPMGSVKAAIRGGSVLLALIGLSLPGYADVTTERSSSILIFPKVIATSSDPLAPATVDTIIQISNTSNSMAFAHCFYVNGAPGAQCQETDFDIYLTKQQPTHWIVSTGRRVESNTPADKTCNFDQKTGVTFEGCFNAGLDPGFIPPVSGVFTGELRCIEVDSSGAPINGNHLKGEATIVTANGDASKYNAIGIMGLNTNTNSNNGDGTLCLGGGVSDSCPTGAEYNACPQTLILNHFASGASDPVLDEFLGGPSRVTTELTLVPCTDDFENQIPGRGVIQFLITNEFELAYSTSTTVTCWANFSLNQIKSVFSSGLLGTRFAQTRITPVSTTDGAPQSGFIGVVEEFHFPQASGSDFSRAAANLHGEGQWQNGDVITTMGSF